MYDNLLKFKEIELYIIVLLSNKISNFWTIFDQNGHCAILATPAFSKGSRRCRSEMVFSLLFLFAVSTMG